MSIMQRIYSAPTIEVDVEMSDMRSLVRIKPCASSLWHTLEVAVPMQTPLHTWEAPKKLGLNYTSTKEMGKVNRTHFKIDRRRIDVGRCCRKL